MDSIDSSKEYAAMCRAAKEVQRIKNSMDYMQGFEDQWLPTLGQLVRMFGEEYRHGGLTLAMLRRSVFAVFVLLEGEYFSEDGAIGKGDTPEKAMLSAVMFAKHRKTWNGKEWE